MILCHKVLFEHHIPSKVTRNSMNTEFESFYQSLLRNISTIPEERIARLKTQLRSKIEKYYYVKIPFRYREAIKRLSNNKNINASIERKLQRTLKNKR